MNRIFQVNDCEGPYKRVLCVCLGGILRSPTAALVLSQPPYDFNTRSCGSEPYALIPASQALIEWADEIVCMKEENALRLKELFDGVEKCIILDIRDEYDYRDPGLIALIKRRYDSLRRDR